LEGEVLGFSNSIGIDRKGGIWINGSLIKFGFEYPNESFNEGDFVGIGMIHHTNLKMECFATWNGVSLGKIIYEFVKM